MRRKKKKVPCSKIQNTSEPSNEKINEPPQRTAVARTKKNALLVCGDTKNEARPNITTKKKQDTARRKGRVCIRQPLKAGEKEKKTQLLMKAVEQEKSTTKTTPYS